MQVPGLFYVVCIPTMLEGPSDLAQLRVAWVFVAVRGVHPLVYLLLNHVPTRFATWVAGCIAVFVLWTRLGLHVVG